MTKCEARGCTNEAIGHFMGARLLNEEQALQGADAKIKLCFIALCDECHERRVSSEGIVVDPCRDSDLEDESGAITVKQVRAEEPR